MNPSTALARVLVDELVRGGVQEAVLAPGSRSAPLAFALHRADAAGDLRLHVRIDERSAGFLALGLAKASGAAVPVVTTSGTAAGNLFPAALEAAHADVLLLLLTADRPPELRATGANQSVDQVKMYGDAVRMFAEVGVPEARPGQVAYWRSLVCRALATGGPVHLNLGLREPLVPDGDDSWLEPLEGRPGGRPWTAVVRARAAEVPDDLPARTLVVLGDARPGQADAALRLAEERGWPVVAEPSSGAGASPVLLAGGDLALGHGPAPDRVLVVGRPTLSRVVGRLLAGAQVDVVGDRLPWADATRTATRVLPAVPVPSAGGVDAGWLPTWLAAGVSARAQAQAVLDQPVPDQAGGLSEPGVAQEVLRAAVDLLVVGSSKPVRDLFLAGTRDGVRVLANRGAAGIDGAVSTAVGAALASQRAGGGHAYALLGDLTFLHDANGLVIGPGEPRPDLTIVVVNNDGGAIFGLLEQGGAGFEAAFERVFGTPHGVDLAALCAATRTPYAVAGTLPGLREALRPAAGIRVVEVRTDRGSAVALDRALHEAADR